MESVLIFFTFLKNLFPPKFNVWVTNLYKEFFLHLPPPLTSYATKILRIGKIKNKKNAYLKLLTGKMKQKNPGFVCTVHLNP